MRITQVQREYLRNTFKDQDTVKHLRKIFLKKELTEDEVLETKRLVNSDTAISTLRTMFLPEFSYEMPVGMNNDLFRALETKNLPSEYVNVLVKGTFLMQKHLEAMFNRLEGKEHNEADIINLDFAEVEDMVENHINLEARNAIIGLVEFKCVEISVLANKSDEELTELRRKNSTQ